MPQLRNRKVGDETKPNTILTTSTSTPSKNRRRTSITTTTLMEEDGGPQSPHTPHPTESKHTPITTPPKTDVDLLRQELIRVNEEKVHAHAILSELAHQDWDFLIHRTQHMRDMFVTQMDSLQKDVTQLCEFSKRQKQQARMESSHGQGGAPSVLAIRSQSHIKVFRWRDSSLSVLFRTQQEIRTVYHIFVSILILFTAQVFVNEYYQTGSFNISLPTLRHSFGSVFSHVVPLWICMFILHASILPIMWIWRKGWIPTSMYVGVYVVLQIAFYGIFGSITWKWRLPIASSFIVLCEQVRMSMKTHSFMRETIRIGRDATSKTVTPSEDDMQGVNSRLTDSFSIQIERFLYFHFVPTLIYRNSYPRTPQIRWRNFFLHLTEVCGCIFYTYVIFANFCIPQFKRTACDPTNHRAFILAIFNSMLPAMTVYLMAFFGLLHAWFNAFAELTRFADRLFYQDWWNSTSFSTYYRKWNGVVHDWCFNYVFMDLKAAGGSQTVSMVATFAISALIHEYIIAVAIGFFYPVLLIMFLGFGVFFIYLTKFWKGSRGWNIFFWTNLIIGNGLLMALYSRESYARHGVIDGMCPPGTVLPPINPDSWMPYSWQHVLTHF